MVAVFFGIWPVFMSQLFSGNTTLMPFAGAMTALLAGACSVNLYGGDGPSLWCAVTTPHAARADSRGRRLAWLLLFGPYVGALTVVLTATSGENWAWPWVLGGVPALLGGGSALAGLGSLMAVLPLADDGGPSPAWSVKIHLALVVGVLPLVPLVALLLAGTTMGIDALRWAAVPVGMAIGLALFSGLGRVAEGRLEQRQVEIYAIAAGHVSPA